MFIFGCMVCTSAGFSVFGVDSFLWHTSLLRLKEQHLKLGSVCAQVKLVGLEICVNFSSSFSYVTL